MLEKFSDNRESVIYETCDLARELIRWNEETERGRTEGLDLAALVYPTNDPAPPFPVHTEPEKYRDVEKMTALMLDGSKSLFERYRAMFTLREINTEEAVVGLC